MQFYRITGLIENEDWEKDNDNRSVRNRLRQQIFAKTTIFNRDLGDKAFICMANTEDGFGQFLALVRQPFDLDSLVKNYMESIGLMLGQTDVQEIRFRDAKNLLSMANRQNYIFDDDEILSKFGLDELGSYRNSIEFEETVLEPAAAEAVYENAREAFSDKTLLPELDRIYKGGKTKAVFGHPVHYLIRTDDRDVRIAIYRPLLQALYAKNRIHSLRYAFTDMRASDSISPRSLDTLYKSCAGGTVVIRYYPSDVSEGERASADRELIELLSECIKKHRGQVLTVLCLPRVCEKIKSLFDDYLGTVTLVELQEDLTSGNKARNYLRNKAAELGIKPDKILYEALVQHQAYLASDLNQLFDEWYNNKLKRSIYPQYKNCASSSRTAVKKVAEGSACDELSKMIGLENAKRVMEEALAYYKAQRLFADKGMKQERAAMHMVFTGNPGTAKTSVARLFARIMRDNGLLSRGHLVEVGRSDLVGKFVGWTAPTVKKKFKEAKGGVLFIDEAYSLVDDRDGMYGDEAINTIVQEMENNRDDMVVIFAGYPDKMQGFLDKNPGLRSRIAFHVPFEDYTAEELCAITRLHAGRKKIELTDEAMDRLSGIYASVLDQKDFGNGRFVRNVLEKAQMAQARRLLTMDPETVTEKEVRTIEAADIEEPPMNRQRDEKRRIGF